MRKMFASMMVLAMVLGVTGLAHAEDATKKVSTVVDSTSKKADRAAKKGKKKAEHATEKLAKKY